MLFIASQDVVGGKPVTDAQIANWADEAAVGYSSTQLRDGLRSWLKPRRWAT